MKIKLPRIYEHMKKLMYDPMFFCLNWFICLFTDKLNLKVSYAVLDLLFIKGGEIIHNIALAVLLTL